MPEALGVLYQHVTRPERAGLPARGDLDPAGDADDQLITSGGGSSGARANSMSSNQVCPSSSANRRVTGIMSSIVPPARPALLGSRCRHPDRAIPKPELGSASGRGDAGGLSLVARAANDNGRLIDIQESFAPLFWRPLPSWRISAYTQLFLPCRIQG